MSVSTGAGTHGGEKGAVRMSHLGLRIEATLRTFRQSQPREESAGVAGPSAEGGVAPDWYTWLESASEAGMRSSWNVRFSSLAVFSCELATSPLARKLSRPDSIACAMMLATSC